MWMVMDSNCGHSPEFNKLPPDTVIGQKLRPLMPRPLSSSSSTPYSTPSCCCIRNPNILSWNHSISDEGVKREIEVVSTRWNPTPEQLQLLEEMYRRGITTPSADQIQQIATKLGRFGKIQGKNVFYWFQNHKARDRQKKRRQLHLLNTHTNHPAPSLLHAAGGVMSNESYLEIEHVEKKKKKVSTASYCGITASDEDDSASMHGAVIAAAGKDEWNHKELQQRPTAENEIRWQLHFDLSSNSNSRPYHPINFNLIHNQHQTLDLFPNPSPPPPPPPPPLLQQYIPPHLTKIKPTQFIDFLPIIKN